MTEFVRLIAGTADARAYADDCRFDAVTTRPYIREVRLTHFLSLPARRGRASSSTSVRWPLTSQSLYAEF